MSTEPKDLAEMLLAALLAEHDRAVAERAWDEGHGMKPATTNPYRHPTTEGNTQ